MGKILGLWHCPEISWNENPSSPTRISWDGIPFFCSSDGFPNTLSEGHVAKCKFQGCFFAKFHEEAERLLLNPPLFGGWKGDFHIPKIADSSIQFPCFFGGPCWPLPLRKRFPRVGRNHSASMRHERHAWDRNQRCPLAGYSLALISPGCRGSLSEQLMKQFNLREGQDGRHWNKWCGWNLMLFVAELVTNVDAHLFNGFFRFL